MMGKGETTPLVTGVPLAGGWKDGLFNCCKYGCFHPSILCALCFPQLLLAQVLTRLKLSVFGDPAPEEVYKTTFLRMMLLCVFYAIVTSVLQVWETCDAIDTTIVSDDNTTTIAFDGDDDDFAIITTTTTWQSSAKNLLLSLFALYTIVVMMKARKAIRERYSIPSNGDCCPVFWCGCCTLSQLARQTADYENVDHVAECCSTTGISASASSSVVVIDV